MTGRGWHPEVVRQIAASGVDHAATMQELADASEEQVRRLNEVQRRIEREADE